MVDFHQHYRLGKLARDLETEVQLPACAIGPLRLSEGSPLGAPTRRFATDIGRRSTPDRR
jgi:hypothetical protein